MKRTLFLSGAALLCAACGTTTSDRVARNEAGVREYEIREQPQVNVTGSGTLLRGADDPSTPGTGAFPGKETVHGEIGQFPTAPPEADGENLVHAPPPEGQPLLEPGSGIMPPREGAGAGTLGQAGLQPGSPVSTATIMSQPGERASEVDEAMRELAETPVIPDSSPRNTGASAGPETGRAEEPLNDPPAVPPAGITALDPAQSASGETPLDELTLRVREVLSSGRPGTMMHLTPERLENIDIEAANGVVTLSGEVQSEAEKRMIENRVGEIEGVAEVNNQLRVVPSTQFRPEQTPQPLDPVE